MTVTYKDYVLKPEVSSYGLYNLYNVVIGKSGNGKGKTKLQGMNYGITMERACFVIAEMEMAKSKKVEHLFEYGKILKKYKSEILLK